MFLTRIELVGFKSFADKTVCTLGEGITAIVGPNGCGKSNIVEAIRWVLGEQRPSALRGKAMGDVIFSGSSSMGPVSMAQVTLVFDNASGTLPYDAPEVSITRRLYRDGEGKYLLNMRPCMLREIKEILYNSGLGAPEYAILQREMTDLLLANRASERRILLEEAAGIMRYRAHIKQSLSRLQGAEASIVRLADIVQERERVVRRLKGEAAVARKAKACLEEVARLRRELAASSLRALRSEAERLREKVRRAREEGQVRGARLARLEADVQEYRLRLSAQEARVEGLVGELARAREEVSSTTAAWEVARARRSDMARERDRLQEEAEAAAARETHARAQHAQVEAEAEGVRRERDAVAAEVASHEAERAADLEAVRRARDEEARAREALREARERLREATHERDKASLAASHTQEVLEGVGRELEAVAMQREEARRRAEEATRVCEALHVRLRELSVALEGHAHRAKRCRDLAARADAVAQSAALAHREAEARRDVLQATLESHEGFSEGARFIMAAKPEGLLGLLGEEVVAKPGYERAVEAALAEGVDSVVVAHRDAARRLLELLRLAGAGRARVVESALAGRRNGPPPEPVQGHGVVGPLLDAVEAPDPLCPVVRALLGRSLLLTHLPPDEEVHDLWACGWEQLVTMEGDVLRADGIHQGGGESGQGVLGRRRALERARRQVAREAARHERFLRRAARLRALADEEEAHLQRLGAERGRLALERERAVAQREAAVEAASRADAQEERLEREAARLEADLRAIRERLARAQEEVTVWGQRVADALALHERAVRCLEEAETTLAAHERGWGDLRGRLGALESRLAEACTQAETLALRVEAEARLLPQLTQRLASLDRELEAVAGDVVAREKRAEEARVRAQELESLLEEARAGRGRLVEEGLGLEERAEGARREVHRAREEAHDAELELARCEASLHDLENWVRRELQVDPRTLYELDPTGSTQELQRRLEEVQARYSALGDVNVRASDQFEEESAQLRRLKQELEDVRESRERLLSSIDQANRSARERFAQTLARVNAHFQDTYATLVPGGQARLELRGEGGLLSQEIEIMVRPPGKRLRSVDLLSGGERALIALAFLFAVYREKAGPLCVLDEVDAPLDDANIARFMDMLEGMSSATQFIVVTHCKQTMARASRLIGVTMEGGVSRLVPVDLKTGGQ